MKIIFFISFLSTVLVNSFAIINDKIIISVSKKGSTLHYKIENKSGKGIYIPTTYYLRSNKDSIIMESLYKVDKKNREIDYTPNSFLPPEMKKVVVGSALTKHQKLNVSETIKNRRLFFRVYFKDGKELLNQNKFESSRPEFLKFESKNSILIEATVSGL